MFKKYIFTLIGLAIIIAWLSIDENFGYLGSSFIVLLFAGYFIFWQIPRTARLKKLPYRLSRVVLNLFVGIFVFFLTLENEVNDLNLAFNSEFNDGKVTNIAKDRCQRGLKKKKGYQDCWRLQISAAGRTFKDTTVTEGKYVVGSPLYVLVAGPEEKDWIKYDWVPFFGEVYTRTPYEIHDTKFDQKEKYLNDLKSNFGLVMGIFSIALILIGMRWITVIGVKYTPLSEGLTEAFDRDESKMSLQPKVNNRRAEPTFSKKFLPQNNPNNQSD
ncbi:hypothetical protein N9L40_01435 [Rhodobacteraceae bacterium]|nr:hypothetical protein [Paracoccaceae bacterium]